MNMLSLRGRTRKTAYSALKFNYKMSDNVEDNASENGPTYEDFLIVASHKSMEGFSLPVVAAALGYKKDDQIDKLVKSQKTKHAKFIDLFLHWKKENEGNKCTWSVFISLLQHLNSKELIEQINNIRGQRGRYTRHNSRHACSVVKFACYDYKL